MSAAASVTATGTTDAVSAGRLTGHASREEMRVDQDTALVLIDMPVRLRYRSIIRRASKSGSII